MEAKRVPIETLLERVGSMYKLVNLAARRALELSSGAPKLVEAGPKEKASIISLREVAEGKVALKPEKKGKKKEE